MRRSSPGRGRGGVVYIATAEALDEEMVARIQHHREARPDDWQTRELPAGVGQALMVDPPQSGTILLDCLTLLVSNLLLQSDSADDNAKEEEIEQRVDQEIDSLIEAIQTIPADWIVVSNEVGMGLVPPYPLGRIYRDLLGRANQRLAQHADIVVLMVAGMPMRLAPMD